MKVIEFLSDCEEALRMSRLGIFLRFTQGFKDIPPYGFNITHMKIKYEVF